MLKTFLKKLYQGMLREGHRRAAPYIEHAKRWETV